MCASLGADVAMLMHLGMTGAFRCAGATKCNAGGQLRLEELTVTNLIGAGHDACCRGTNRRAILIEADAGDQPLDFLGRKTGIGASGAGFNAGGTGGDTAADGIDMTRLLRMGTEHRADGDCGHAEILLAVCWPNQTHESTKGSEWNFMLLPPNLNRSFALAC